MKKKFTGVLLVIISCLVVTVFCNNNTFARLTDVKKKDDGGYEQCFDIRYMITESYISMPGNGKDDTGDQYSGGGYVTATNIVCADVDKDGKIVGDEFTVKGHASDVNSSKMPTISYNGNNKKSIRVSYCKDLGVNDTGCDRAGFQSFDQENFYIDENQSFESLANEIYDLVNNNVKIEKTDKKETKLLPMRGETSAYTNDDAKKIADNAAKEANPTIENPDESEADDSEDDKCFKGAGAIGWAVCPIITKTIELLGNVYSDVEQNYLQIPATDIFDTTKGTYQAWDTFRNIANIVFVILLLVVILSQVTGIGITNYGIKKILPRLIIVAVLINLSYIICMLLVDISNIIGMSLRTFLTNIAGQIEQGASAGSEYSASGAQYIVTLGTVAAISITAAVINPGLLLTAALFLISAAIAVLFLWVILIVRQAGVILLVAIAPVALCCFLLPNTEKLSKKWIEAMKGLLLLYPICSLLVGGGVLAGNILGSVNSGENAGLALAAMILQVIPFFFIPTVFKKSMNAMGNLGAKISSAGSTFGRGAKSRIGNMDSFKRAQERGNQRANRIRSGLDKDGNLTSVGRGRAKFARSKFGTMVGADRALAQRQSIARADTKKGTEADVALLEGMYRDKELEGDGGVQEAFEAAYNSGNTKDVRALAAYATQRFGSAGVAKMVSNATFNNSADRVTDNQKNSLKALRDLTQENSNFFNALKNKNTETASLVSAAGSGGGARFYAQEGNNVFGKDLIDFAAASELSLQHNADNGALTPDIAQKLLNSDDPTIKSKLTSNAKKREILERVANRSGTVSSSSADTNSSPLNTNIGTPAGPDSVSE